MTFRSARGDTYSKKSNDGPIAEKSFFWKVMNERIRRDEGGKYSSEERF